MQLLVQSLKTAAWHSTCCRLSTYASDAELATQPSYMACCTRTDRDSVLSLPEFGYIAAPLAGCVAFQENCRWSVLSSIISSPYCSVFPSVCLKCGSILQVSVGIIIELALFLCNSFYFPLSRSVHVWESGCNTGLFLYMFMYVYVCSCDWRCR